MASGLEVMLARLTGAARRFAELTDQLGDPAMIADARRLRELSVEHAALRPVVEAYHAWRAVRQEREGAEELLRAGDDPELAHLAAEERDRLAIREQALVEQLRVLLLPRDPLDGRNVILEIRGGTGGDEAALFAGDLFRMYQRYVEDHRWRLEVLSASPGSQGGFKELIALISGADVYSHLKYESGVHRVQRVPDTETQGRIHTSAVTVVVLPEAEEVDVQIDEAELRIDTMRSGGAGGQHVNKTESAVRITHLPTNLVVVCQDEKSQHKNKSKALKILRARLLDQKRAAQEAEISAARKAMVRSGDRSEKIRTYNFPQDRCTDHRIGLTLHNLPKIMSGGLDELVTALRAYYQAEALQGQAG